MAAMEERQILKLPEIVINRIAAGEVIQRPANVVKELVENSLDAGSTHIVVSTKSGGAKLLQVQDNGSGIRSSDLELLCQRFTTSKLRKFEDLQTIATYGFRGEALASISHVAHVTVVTKTAGEVCAYRADYEDGLLKQKPKPCAGNQGTQITIEDLFYNMPIRRNALKAHADESKKITEILIKYAVHNFRVGFLLKRHGETTVDVRTTGASEDVDDRTATENAISAVYGASLARELLPFDCDQEVSSAQYGFSARGFVSNTHYSSKKFTFILFINHRLVECGALKKSIEMVYANYASSKGVFPFVYVGIELPAHHVDVNVHPTKEEVLFLHENVVIECVSKAIDRVLSASNQTKTFVTKTLVQRELFVDSSQTQQQPQEKRAPQKLYDHQMVRTDSRDRRLDEFFDVGPSSSTAFSNSQNIRVNYIDFSNMETEDVVPGTPAMVKESEKIGTVAGANEEDSLADDVSVIYASDPGQPSWRPITLLSIINLQKIVRSDVSQQLRSLIAGHSFVGCIDPQYALIQYQTGLYMVNTTALSEELFYQILLFQFSNFNAYRLTEKCKLSDLIFMGIPASRDEATRRRLAGEYSELILSKATMLNDYFSLEFNKDGYLVSVPWLLEKYAPQLEALPVYLYRLATAVDWTCESEFLRTFCRETSKFYALKKRYCKGDLMTNMANETTPSWKSVIETVLYPTFKKMLLPPKAFASTDFMTKLTDVQDLYKVFERC